MQRGEPCIPERRQIILALKDYDHMEMRMPAVRAATCNLRGRHAPDHAGLNPGIGPMSRPSLLGLLHPIKEIRKIVVATVPRRKRQHHDPVSLGPRPGEELIHLIAAGLRDTRAAARTGPDRPAGLQALVMNAVELPVAIRRRDHVYALALRDHRPAAETNAALPTKEASRVPLMPEPIASDLGVANGFRSITESAYGAALTGLFELSIRGRSSAPPRISRRQKH